MLFLLILANFTERPRILPRPQRIIAAQTRRPSTEFNFNLVTAGCSCVSYDPFAPINHLLLEASQNGINPSLIGYLLPILNAASLFGRLSSETAGDKIGRYSVFVFACAHSRLYILALWLPATGEGPTIAFAVLYGFSSGGYISLLVPLVVQIPLMSEIEFRSGIVLFATAVAGLTTNPINGATLGSSGGWVGLKTFSGVFYLVGTLFILMARMRRTHWKLSAVF